MHFPNRCISIDHHSHFIIGRWRPKYFNFFSLWISNNLSTHIGLITLIKDINTHIDNHIGKVNFFIRCKSQLLNSKCFSSSKTRNSSHHFINVSWLGSMVIRCSHLSIQFLYVFHCPRAVIWWYWTWLSNWMNMPHVIDRRWWTWMKCLNVCIYIFCCW